MTRSPPNFFQILPKSPWTDELGLTNVTIARVYYLKTTDDEWYYSNEEPSVIGGGDYRSIHYYKNLNLDKLGTQKRVTEIANPRAGTRFEWLSPQSTFSQEVLREHQALKLINWDRAYLKILVRLFNDQEMDPVFKYQLLQAIIQPALQGSWSLQQGFQRHHDNLLAGTVNTQENYLDPRAEESRAVRQAARQVIEQLPDVEASVKAVEAAIQKMQEFRVRDRYEWVGWLHLDRQNNWVCDRLPNKKPPNGESGDLHIIYAVSPSGPPEVRSIGKLAAGQFQLSEPSDGAFVAGRPVFMIAASTD